MVYSCQKCVSSVIANFDEVGRLGIGLRCPCNNRLLSLKEGYLYMFPSSESLFHVMIKNNHEIPGLNVGSACWKPIQYLLFLTLALWVK